MRQFDRYSGSTGAVMLLLVLLAGCSKEKPEQFELPSLGASGPVTVSGLSSGGYMAGQFQVAFSGQVVGAGIVAAGPWGCAQGDINRALQVCVSGNGLDTAELIAMAGEKAGDRGIDPLDNLGNARVFLFRGDKDEVVGSAAIDGALRWFANYTNPVNIKVVDTVPAAHGWPTINSGGDCGTFAAPYVYNCDYDTAGEILGHLYTELEKPAEVTREVRRFEQRSYGDASLAEFGYVYIPEHCENEAGCRVHVFFHGCEQSADTVGTELVENSGFNRWAEANDIVVLYPQVEKSFAAPMNPLGCWDWWGYTGANYLDQSGAQLNAVKRMVDRLAFKSDQ